MNVGVFKKLKDVLFDVEEELPVITKKENADKTEEKLPKYKEENTIKEIKIPKEELTERELMKSESTFNFPVEIDEPPLRSNRNYNFDDEPIRKPEPSFSKLFHEDVKKDKEKEKNRSSFKPTPIISPVYGILDQNYSKDDVIVKTDVGVKKPDLDEIRKKAYGIKEKKLEIKSEEEVIEDDALKTLDEILMEEEKTIITEKRTIKTPKIEDDELSDEPFSDEISEEKSDHDIDNTIESDLFNLIDSMYENKEESEEE